jgi:hypothetical protein
LSSLALEKVIRVADRFICPAIRAAKENPEFSGEEKIMKTGFWKDRARDGRRDHGSERKRSFPNHPIEKAVFSVEAT